MSDAMKVAVVGSGYVGTVVAASLAKVGHRVVGVEVDPEKLARLQAGAPTFFEPGLPMLLGAAMGTGRLTFTDAMATALDGAEIVFLCVGTPPGIDGRPDMSAVASAATSIGQNATGRHVVVTKSTVPVGSGMWLERIIERAVPEDRRDSVSVSVASNPEFLREGSAIDDFLFPDRIVVGSDDGDAIETVARVYRPIIEQSFPGGDPARRPPFVRTSLATAEMIKYTANAFLAMKISFINEIANICERVGADVTEVAHAIGYDHRIGRPFLNAGVGWGGSCFGKDLDALASMAEDYGLEPTILSAVKTVNTSQREVVVEKLQQHLKMVRGRHIALLGLAFKPGTDDLRDAPSLYVARRLHDLGAHITAHDPIVKEVPDLDYLQIRTDPYDAVDGADAVVLMTEWDELVGLRLPDLAARMAGDLVLDARNALDPESVVRAGLAYEGIGRTARAYAPPRVKRPQRG